MISRKIFLVSVIGMLVTLTTVGFISIRPKPVVVRTNLEGLPMEIAGYRGVEDVFSASVYQILNADMNVYRHYMAQDGNQLNLYIGYYGTAKGGRTEHNPNICLPGAGWQIVDSRKVRIPLSSQASDVEVNYIRARKDTVNTVMVYWYQTAGTTVVSTGLQQNIERFWGRLLHNRNDGAFVQVTSLIPDDQVVKAGTTVQDFAIQVIRILPRYWPIEK